MNENFSYVIAHPWYEEDGELCTYMLAGKEIHYGTAQEAQKTLDYVISQTAQDKPNELNDYRIYKVVPYE